MKNLVIRPIDPQDVAPAMELVQRVFSEFVAPEYTDEGSAEFQAFLETENITNKMERGELRLWGAFESEKIIGMMGTKPPLHISLLFVDKQYHRRGIARNLFHSVLHDEATVHGHERITVNSSPYAVEVYRRLGFVPTDTERTKNGLRFTPMAFCFTNSHDIPLADAMIHCKIVGNKDAPALVLLHGNGEDLHIFDQQIVYFSQFYRTIAIDTRGHGKSTRGTKPLNFHTFAADLVGVLDALQVDKANIVGFSDGAITALHAALATPKRISAMVLLGVNYHPKGILFKYRLLVRLMYIWLSVASLFSAKICKRREIWGLMVSQPCLTIEVIAQITIPTLVVTGENDMVSQRHNDEINSAIKDSKRLVIKGGDHFWMCKQPELLHQCVMEFLHSNH